MLKLIITAKKIINYRKKIIISFLLDLIAAIIVNFLFNKNHTVTYVSYFYILALPSWILISYIFGRYHDFKKIDNKSIIKNLFKTFLISFVFINISFIFERNNIINFKYFYSINELSFFYYIYGSISLVFNLIFNLFLIQKRYNNKWIILESNKLLKYLEKDNIESFDYLLRNLILIKSIDQINNYKSENYAGLILEENKELDKKLVLNLKKKGIKTLGNIEWCEEFLYRIPPNAMKEELNKNKFLYSNYNLFEYKIKRIIELFITILLILASAPVIILSALLIYKEDRGPIFYSQIRRGIYGKSFRIFKLRTMTIDSEKDGIQWSSKNDPRITKIGSFLRKSRIDELPQLISVISGDMNLIGPRPERPEIDNILEKKIPGYQIKYFITPGITGWAQVNYPYGASVQDSYNKFSYDLYYLRNFSIFLDILILFKTIRVVLDYKNASFNL